MSRQCVPAPDPTYHCRCHWQMGNDFWFLPAGDCLLFTREPIKMNTTTKSLLTLVGTKFRKAGLKLLAATEDRHPVLLVREPGNKVDPNAIAVYVPIGYIKAAEAATWAAQFDTLNPVGTVPGLLVMDGVNRNVEIDA